MATDIKMLNRLRRTCRSHWEADSEIPQAIVYMGKNPEACDEIMESFRTIASEMGLRHVHLCLVNGLTDEHRKLLDRKGPRIVTLTDIDGIPEGERPDLHKEIAEGARTLVACLIHAPEECIPRLSEAWRNLQRLGQRKID